MDPILTGEDEYRDRDLVSTSNIYLAGDFGPVPVQMPEFTGSTVSLGSGTTMDSPQMDTTLLELPKKPVYTNLGKWLHYTFFAFCIFSFQFHGYGGFQLAYF